MSTPGTPYGVRSRPNGGAYADSSFASPYAAPRWVLRAVEEGVPAFTVVLISRALSEPAPSVLNMIGLPETTYQRKAKAGEALRDAAGHRAIALMRVVATLRQLLEESGDAGQVKDLGDVVPEGRFSRALGSAWLPRQSSALLCVPSVIIQEEVNVLVNPSHIDAKRLTTHRARRFIYDQRV